MKRLLAAGILPLLFAPTLAVADDTSPLAFFSATPEDANRGNALAFVSSQEAAPPADAAEPAGKPTLPRSAPNPGTASADVAKIAAELGVPAALALAVCRVESHCRYGVSGAGGVHGPLQIKAQTARGLGFSGSPAALRGYDGAYYGVKHLAMAYKKCGTVAGAAKLHQAGLRANCGRSGYSAKVARFM
jgi:soluble lytic murein transglycosylase-like protein